MPLLAPGRRPLCPTLLLTAALGAALGACGSDEIQAPPDPVEGTLTVDASQGWGFASLADEGTVVVTDPTGSAAWDIAFNATNVMLNGGAAGPGDVEALCLCQNAGATDEQVLAMTAEGELADFEAVTAADIPSSGFQTETLAPALDGWFSGATATAPEKAWLLRLDDGTAFAKLRITAVEGATTTSAGRVTVEYAVQPTADAPLGPVQTATLDATSPALDLTTGATGTAEAVAGWDLRLDGTVLRLNGGVSGSGSAAAALATEPFDAITTASIEPRAYKTDTFAGVFGAHPWYRYNLTGDHKVHPTYDVYLVRRGDDVYKLQLVNYYGPAGETRRISFRYAQLTD